MAIDYGLTSTIVIDEQIDLKKYPLWICDMTHGYPAWTPLQLYSWLYSCCLGFSDAAETLSLPQSMGWEWKIYNGYPYITVLEPEPEEVPAREKLFRERMAQFVEDPGGEWLKDRDRIWGLHKRIREVDIAKVSLVQLRKLFDEGYRAYEEIHFTHMKWMYALYLLNQRFIDACDELTGIKPDDPLHAKLRSGFDNTLFQIDKEMWLLGRKATEMGLADVFLTTADDEELMSKLKESDEGRKWLDEFLEFLKLRGWRSMRMADFATVTWIEQPSLGLPDIKRAMAKGGEFTPDVERERLTKEREQAERELMAKVPTEQREWFGKLLKVAQMSASWTEDHTPFCEIAQSAILRKPIWEIGKRFARAGVIDEPFDVFMLMPWEIRKAIVPLASNDLRRLARWRREEWHKALKIEPPPFLGHIERVPELADKDPVIRVLAAVPAVRPELKADIYGAASSPGVAEGVARVLLDERQLGEIQPGDILVAPFTTTTWISAFHMVKGVVTDMGGSLAHAVIMGREFAIPVVAGTLEGTKKIETGQRIRVDGDNMAIYILEQATK